MKINLLTIKEEEYHALPFNKFLLPDIANAGYVSGSLLAKTSDLAKFMTEKEFQPSASMEWGSLVDCLITQPESFNERYVVIPEDAPRKPSITQINAKKPSPDTVIAVAYWKKMDEDKRIKISSEMLYNAQCAKDAFLRNDACRETLESSDSQIILVDETATTVFPGLNVSLKRKCMMDFLRKDNSVIADLKTTNDNSDRGIYQAIYRFKYHMKMAFYQIMCEDCYGQSPELVLHFQRSEPPYDTNSVKLGPKMIAEGREAVIEAIKKLAQINPKNEASYMNYGIKEIDSR